MSSSSTTDGPERRSLPDREGRPDSRSLLAKIADELRHNDECAPGPLSDDEYMDDARAIYRIVDDHWAATNERLRAEVERLKAPEGWEDELNAAWATVNQVRTENERLRDVMRDANRHGCRAMNKVRDRSAPNTAAQRSAAEDLGRALDLLQAEVDSRRTSDEQGAPRG